MANDVEAQVKAIIADILSIEEEGIDMDDRFREDLGADSLDLVELIMAFEDEFGGRISDDDAREITTVGHAVTYLKEKMLEQQGQAEDLEG
ncbi:MAG: acyl carrier protein [Anaerolineae bacterium]